jgi:hypothetical protein
MMTHATRCLAVMGLGSLLLLTNAVVLSPVNP